MEKMLSIFIGISLALAITSPLSARKQITDSRFAMVNVQEDSIPCSASIQSELESIYTKYNHAAGSGNFEEYYKYLVEQSATFGKQSLKKLSKEELTKRKKLLQQLPSQNISVDACLISPGTDTAALAASSMSLWQGKLVNGREAVLFKKEGEFWKVQMVGWSPNR